MIIDAAIWQRDQQHRQNVSLAWHVAALMRTKNLPGLQQLLAVKPAKRLTGQALQERRNEHREMTAHVNLDKLARRLNDNRAG